MIYFVSKSGNDHNDGSSKAPLLTIQAGVNKLLPGSKLIIEGGIYTESVKIAGKHGTQWKPITIEGADGSPVYIDGVLEDFSETGIRWIRAFTLDPNAHPDEYVSDRPITVTEAGNDGIKGAFYENAATHYTRLINYSILKDLSSSNEKFGKILEPADLENFVQVVNDNGEFKTVEVDGKKRNYFYPFFYMGPGIWLDRNDPADTANYGRIHIRLSHTNNNVEGLADYTGDTDPNNIVFAISKKETISLDITGSEWVSVKNCCIRFGGANTAHVQNSSNIVFDGVKFCCSEFGLKIGGTNGLEVANCEFDGGLPSWYFRSDRKSEYHFMRGSVVATNNVGSKTSSSLITGGQMNKGINIHHCEFWNGHDVYMPGEVTFNNNLVSNMNDDAIFIDQEPGSTARIHHNVFTKCLTCFSFQGKPALAGGPWYIYRNLIDLRLPTASFRPFHDDAINEDDEREVFRLGWLHKSNGASGNYHHFQNTIIAFSAYATDAYFTHLKYKGTPLQPRSSFNNIFVGINHHPAKKKALMLFPLAEFKDITDGNLYYRLGTDLHKPFQSMYYDNEGKYLPGPEFKLLSDYTGSGYCDDSEIYYPPGCERNSIYGSPKFKHMTNHSFPSPLPFEDLRLAEGSPAIGKGLNFTDIPHMKKILDDHDPLPGGNLRDLGCYAYNALPLKVGRKGRYSFPNILTTAGE